MAAAGGGQLRQRGGGKGNNKNKPTTTGATTTPAADNNNANNDPAAAARRAMIMSQKRRKQASAKKVADRDARRRRALGLGAAACLAGVVAVASIWDYWHRPSSSSGGAAGGRGGNGGRTTASNRRELQEVPPQLANDDNWDRTDSTLNATHRFLSSFVCDHPDGGAYCHPHLQPVPTRRTHKVSSSNRGGGGVEPGHVILVLPRSLQIWDLDALRDSWVREELLGATHGMTGNWVDSGAYLAAYLIRRRMIARDEWDDGKDDEEDVENGEKRGDGDEEEVDPLLPYLDVLPTYDDLEAYHPTLWSQSDLDDLLGRYTPSVMLVKAYSDMCESEYRALASASVEFRTNVGRDEYVAMRINVLSRSFGPGPPGEDERRVVTNAEGEEVDGPSMEDELEFYERVAGIDLSLGCRAMAPVLDMWDSHPRPNAEWRYDPSRRAFVVWAATGEGGGEGGGGIPPGHDVIVSYGRYTESHLFAKFGYVNGDGSSHTEAYINSIHRLLDVGLERQFSYLPWDGEGNFDATTKQQRSPLEMQRFELARYLQFDDGYDECIVPDVKGEEEEDEEEGSSPSGASEAWELKKLKFRHLEAIANVRHHWVARMGPRNPTSGPGMSSAVPPVADRAPMPDPKSIRFNANDLVSTCRLIALTQEDYDGEAVRVLADVLANDTADAFVVERMGDALEYRAISCIVRLVDMMLWRYPSRVRRDMKLLSSASIRASFDADDDEDDEDDDEPRPDFRSKEWTAAHVRLGEMQSLEMLGGTMKMAGRQTRRKAEVDPTVSPAALTIRHRPCPIDDTLALLDPKTRMMGENYVKATRTNEKG